VELHVSGTEIYVDTNTKKTELPRFDPLNKAHFWAMFGVWSIDPAKAVTGEQSSLDLENLVSIQGPACLFCEQVYSSVLAKMQCKGRD
jgi:hypothetical protein